MKNLRSNPAEYRVITPCGTEGRVIARALDGTVEVEWTDGTRERIGWPESAILFDMVTP
jgi:hypothetical protein